MNATYRIPQSPPPILPIDAGIDNRPVWSVMIPAYNCGRYLPETLKSVLLQAQDKQRMQIEVCDDASTDIDVKGLVEQIGKGRITYFRQPENTGSLRNFETCLNRSKGEFIHLLHGDDKIRPGFYEQMENLFLKCPDIGMAFCRYYSLDQSNGTAQLSHLEREGEGILDNWLEKIACKQRIQTPAVVVKRSVYEKLGGFYAVHYGEDWEMWVRIAAHFPVGYTSAPLAEYRKHEQSISGQYILTGKNIDDLKKVMELHRKYIPEMKWKSIHRTARKSFAIYAINTARKIWGRSHNKEGTQIQIKKAWELHISRNIIYQSLKLYMKMILGI